MAEAFSLCHFFCKNSIPPTSNNLVVEIRALALTLAVGSRFVLKGHPQPMDVNKAIEKQLANIETRTGKTLAQLEAIIKKSGLTKHESVSVRII